MILTIINNLPVELFNWQTPTFSSIFVRHCAKNRSRKLYFKQHPRRAALATLAHARPSPATGIAVMDRYTVDFTGEEKNARRFWGRLIPAEFKGLQSRAIKLTPGLPFWISGLIVKQTYPRTPAAAPKQKIAKGSRWDFAVSARNLIFFPTAVGDLNAKKVFPVGSSSH